MKHKRMKPAVMFGLMIIGMIVFMAAFGFMFGGMNPMAMLMSSGGSLGLGMWGVMIIPLVGVVLMLVMMFFAFRWMTGSNSPMGMMSQQGASNSKIGNHNFTTLTYDIPSVNCAHCKMKIEQAIGALPGVASVNVDVAAQQAVVELIKSPTKAEIKELLADIGYPAEN
ncbi:MAG: cation transporter [Anaerolineales bacterium]|nr:cation transporter [Chloroflexota bacterium]MBL6979604.1 cation transporter [Anaerolineales bacterium]